MTSSAGSPGRSSGRVGPLWARVSEARIDESVRRLLREVCARAFDQPFIDVERAVGIIGRADFVAEGEAAQRAAIVRPPPRTQGPAVLPLGADQAVYTEHRLGGSGQAWAGWSTTRLTPTWLCYGSMLRTSLGPAGLESFFHAGSLEFPAAERNRIVAVCEQVPTIVVLFLDRPAIVPEIADAAAALLVEFGARDDAVVDVLLGEAQARGRLPFDLPSSMKAVIESRSDVPYDTAEPRFRFGEGIVAR